MFDFYSETVNVVTFVDDVFVATPMCAAFFAAGTLLTEAVTFVVYVVCNSMVAIVGIAQSVFVVAAELLSHRLWRSLTERHECHCHRRNHRSRYPCSADTQATGDGTLSLGHRSPVWSSLSCSSCLCLSFHPHRECSCEPLEFARWSQRRNPP